tara:strand:+ start:3245 stop:3904 length:660 start_codon:yes stop_codon:yes gene_type:complete
MRDMNTVHLLGTIKYEPRTNSLKNGGKVSNISVCTSEQRGEYDINTFHDVVCWKELAEGASKLKVGDRVLVKGRIEKSNYEDKGVKKYTTKIVASHLAKVESEFTEEASEENSTPKPPAPSSGPAPSKGGPAGLNFSNGEAVPGPAFPFKDFENDITWESPDESGMSYGKSTVDPGATFCAAWTEPAKPEAGAALYRMGSGATEWEEHGRVLKTAGIPF